MTARVPDVAQDGIDKRISVVILIVATFVEKQEDV